MDTTSSSSSSSLQGTKKTSFSVGDTASSSDIYRPQEIGGSNSFVWSNSLTREQKVVKLSTLCEGYIDGLYDCEMANGPNSEKCTGVFQALQICMSSNLCPSELDQKKSLCNEPAMLRATFGSRQPPSPGNTDPFNECYQISQRLNSCLDSSLKTIWTSPDSLDF
eukprot:gene7580-8871_t